MEYSADPEGDKCQCEQDAVQHEDDRIRESEPIFDQTEAEEDE